MKEVLLDANFPRDALGRTYHVSLRRSVTYHPEMLTLPESFLAHFTGRNESRPVCLSTRTYANKS